ncbi:type III polyketide synthase [Microbacterium suaedae]|uniref:type III polyketide synthase n=1 Tax=Microbacterium suaedae TaxID=2067813 RepID=UPI000DA20FD8|nr:type III polyketide synthase [Microbacterium suaedae]
MVTTLRSIGTAVPSTRLPQSQIRDFLAGQSDIDRRASRLIRGAFDHSAIEGRHTVVDELGGGAGAFVDEDAQLRSPTTGERNEIYRREAPPLFAAAASDALARSGFAAGDVSHVITVSCTGFFAPGPDFRLVRDIGLPPTVERYHLGFIGCAAAFPALRAATRIGDAQPGSVVLVVCAELCSLHIRSSSDPEQIVASAVFADGAAAAVVSSADLRSPGPVLEMGRFSTSITSEGEGAMEWTIGDQGFEMTLTAEVPRIIGREIRTVVREMLGDDPMPDAWAVHPGGRSVLDRVQSGLDLPDSAMSDSREVLRKYGNMSSVTVLFILRRILEDARLGDAARVAGLCFGPGLTVESALFTRRTGAA